MDKRDLVLIKKLTQYPNDQTPGDRRLTVPLPPSSGAVTFKFGEDPGEVALVNEAAYEGDVRQSEPVSEQQLPSSFDSFSNQPLVRRYARRLAESA